MFSIKGSSSCLCLLEIWPPLHFAGLHSGSPWILGLLLRMTRPARPRERWIFHILMNPSPTRRWTIQSRTMQVNTFAPSRSPRRAEWFSDRILRAHNYFLFDHLETNSLPNIICCQDHNISTKLSMQYSQHIKHIRNVYFQRSPWRRRRRGLECPDSGSPRPSSVVPRGWSLPESDSLVGPGNKVC